MRVVRQVAVALWACGLFGQIVILNTSDATSGSPRTNGCGRGRDDNRPDHCRA